MQVKLKVLVGKSSGKEIAVPAPRFLVGRSNDCHLRPKSDSVSRNHCTILTRDDHVIIRDLNSRNGTFVNGQRITEDEVIKDGDQLQIGKLEFSVIVKQPKKKPKKKKKPKVEEKPESSVKDPGSLEFDVTEWLQEADGDTKAGKSSEPETRQFRLDETDRLALANATPESDAEEEEQLQEQPGKKKKRPGKLPPRPVDTTGSSRDAAADMLKKFFNNR